MPFVTDFNVQPRHQQAIPLRQENLSEPMITSTHTPRHGNPSLQIGPQKRSDFSIEKLLASHRQQKNVYFSGPACTSDQFGLPFRSNAQKLFNVDISGTFTEAPDYFKEQFRDEQNASLLNTGRSLEYLQTPGKLQELKLADAVVDFLSTDNGMTLYWNKDRLPMEKWIPHLTPESQVPRFKKNMETTFNSTPQAIKDDVLEPVSKYFQTQNPNLPISIKFKPEIKTKCTVTITGERTKELHEEFIALLRARLIALKIKADILKEDRNCPRRL